MFNFHLHGNVWLNDPDFAVFRGRDTSREGMMDWHNHDRVDQQVFDLHEARLWATCTILSGGLVILGDRLAGLNEAGLAIVRTVLELSGGQAAVALDISEPMPSLLLKRDGPRVMLGLLNWTDQSRPVGQGLARTSPGLPDRLADVWTGRRFSVSQLPSVQLAPHSGLLLMAD
jgi:hypothetical protein